MITLPALLVLAPPASAASAVFVGNSYTMVNELDQLVAQLLAEGQPDWADATVTRLADGGLTFADHLERIGAAGTSWEAQLGAEGPAWDWVILQEQSQIPGFPEDDPYQVESLASSILLDDIAEAHGAQTVFYLTWGRESGDTSNPDLYPDFPTMEARLEAGYVGYRDATSTSERPTWIAPVGPAFAWVYQDALTSGDDPSSSTSRFAQLYQDDGSHPSVLGSYLAACVFYATLTGDSPEGLSPLGGLDDDDAAWAQMVAFNVVFDESLGFTYPWSADEVDTGGEDTGGSDTGAVDTAGPDDTSDSGSDEGALNTKESSGGCFGRAGLVALVLGLGRRRR